MSKSVWIDVTEGSVEAGNATESAVQTVTTAAGGNLGPCELFGWNMELTGTADTITIRFYSDSSKTIELSEIDVTFSAVPDAGGYQYTQPIPCPAGVHWTTEAAGGASRTTNVFVHVRPVGLIGS